MIRPFSLFAFLLFAGCGDSAIIDDAPEPASPLPSSPGATLPGADTFENRAIGFGFDYPATLALVESTDVDGRELVVRLLLPEEASDPLIRDRAPGQFEVEVFANPDGLAISDWLDANGWPAGTSETTSSRVEVSGAPALELRSERMLAPNRFIYVAWRERVLALVPLGPDAQAILESFRLF